MIESLLREFWFAAERPGRDLFKTPEAAWERARPLVRVFYCALFFFACWNFDTNIDRFDHMGLDPLWPLYWVRWTGNAAGIRIALLLFLFGSLAAAWAPERRGFRALAFVGVLAGMALDNSFGKINNHLHLWTSVAFMFVFLPNEGGYLRATPSEADRAARVFWGAQALVLLTYSMSGLAKLLGAAEQILRGDAHHLFSLDALARHVAERLMETGETSLAGPWLIDHHWIGPPLLLGAVYLETFALWAAFRPRLHRPWALGHIGMHLGIMLAMNITFSHSMLLLALLFGASPFAAQAAPFSLRAFVEDLPIAGAFARAALDAFSRARPAETLLFYDGACGICNRSVAFLLSHEPPPDLRFATLQGPYYAETLARHPSLAWVDSVIVVRRDARGESVLIRSEVVLWLLARLHGRPRLALALTLIPAVFSDLGYRIVSALRHRIDGGRTACEVLPEKYRSLFLDGPDAVNR